LRFRFLRFPYSQVVDISDGTASGFLTRNPTRPGGVWLPGPTRPRCWTLWNKFSTRAW